MRIKWDLNVAQILLELPGVDAAMVEAFDRILLETNSEKEQRAALKSFLASSGALLGLKSPSRGSGAPGDGGGLSLSRC